MTDRTANPWVARFGRLPTLDEIEQRIRVPAVPTLDLADYPPEIAAIKLERCIESVYLPTRQVCEILQRMLQVAAAHAEAAYEDRKTFLQHLYYPNHRFATRCDMLRDGPLLRCITGPSGVGKSQLLRAFG